MSPVIEVEDSHWRNIERFAGRAMKWFDPDAGLVQTNGIAYYVAPTNPWEDAAFPRMLALVDTLCDDPRAAALEALVIGHWGGPYQQTSDPIVERLVERAPKLSGLRAIYLGEITPEENEISWICQGDPAPLLGAFPALEHLRVRAPGRGYNNGVDVGPLQSPTLRSLCFQSGGLPRQVVEQVMTADLPALEHLELWLGREEYGAGTTAETLIPLLSGKLFPKLSYLGLRNSEQVDAIAAALASAPILEQLETLDLSLGTLTDAGAEALLAAPAIKGLKRLDLRHNFLTPPVADRLVALGIPTVATDPGDAESYEDDGQVHRFTAVGE